jgi:hypothetical protein
MVFIDDRFEHVVDREKLLVEIKDDVVYVLGAGATLMATELTNKVNTTRSLDSRESVPQEAVVLAAMRTDLDKSVFPAFSLLKLN